MHVCFCCVCFSFSVLIQEIGWEERLLRNDLFCVGWDVGRKTLSQSVNIMCHRTVVFTVVDDCYELLLSVRLLHD